MYNTRLGKKLYSLIPESPEFLDYEYSYIAIYDDDITDEQNFVHVVEYRHMLFAIEFIRNGDVNFWLIR